MTRTVYLHIGAPKTGTTYLQSRLALNARTLAEHGVHFPSRNLVTSPELSQFRAALDLLDQDWGGAPGHAKGGWAALVRRVGRLDGTVVISHEILATAEPHQIAKVVHDLRGSELHVVYSARDQGRQLPGGVAGDHQERPHLELPPLPSPAAGQAPVRSPGPSTCPRCSRPGVRRCRSSGST